MIKGIHGQADTDAVNTATAWRIGLCEEICARSI